MSLPDSLIRVRILKNYKKFTYRDLSDFSGVPMVIWKRFFNNKAPLYWENFEHISKMCPGYECWIAFGKERPEYGDISPMTEFMLEQLKLSRTPSSLKLAFEVSKRWNIDSFLLSKV